MTRDDAYRAALIQRRERMDEATRTACNTTLRVAMLMNGQRPVTAVREALAAGADPNARTPLGYTMLTTAILAPDRAASFVRHLVRAGADPEASDAHGNHPLASAAKHGLAPVVTILLDAGGAVEQRTTHGETALELALRHRQAEVAVVLLQAGADLVAAARRNPPCVEGSRDLVAAIGDAVADGRLPATVLAPFLSAQNPFVREAAFFAGTRDTPAGSARDPAGSTEGTRARRPRRPARRAPQ